MKSPEQISRQLRLCKFEESEWLQVLEFCVSECNYKPAKSYKGKFQQTFKQFKEWYESGAGAGDLVRYGRTVAVVSYNIEDQLWFCAYFGPGDRFVNLDGKLYHAKRSDFQLLPEEDEERYVNLIYDNGVSISKSFGLLIKRPTARVGGMYFFKYNDIICSGIVKSKDRKEVTFYFRYSFNDLAEEDLIVPVTDIIRIVESTEQDKIEKEIYKLYGCQWSSFSHSFQYRPFRLPKGSKFYYLTDKFSITSGIDCYNRVCDMRYVTGNYFISSEDAMQFLVSIQNLRSSQIKNRAINR